jgi:hypothetical protein
LDIQHVSVRRSLSGWERLWLFGVIVVVAMIVGLILQLAGCYESQGATSGVGGRQTPSHTVP